MQLFNILNNSHIYFTTYIILSVVLYFNKEYLYCILYYKHFGPSINKLFMHVYKLFNII